MMWPRTRLGLVVIAALLNWSVLAAPRQKPDVKPEAELKKMQGPWTYQSQTIGGRELTQVRLKDIWMEIDGDLMTKAGGGKYKIKLDPTTDPKSIDLVSHEHPSGKTFIHKGIYEWDGETLRICLDNSAKERPKEFRSLAGQDNIYISVLNRKEK
jgi:uncharacterized protein (TIGR03067 family)